MYQQDTDTLA